MPENVAFDRQALMKEVYGKSGSVLGDNNIALRLFPYDGSRKPGSKLKEHVWTSNIHGVTYAGRQEVPTLREPISAKGVNPEIVGSQLMLRARMGPLAAFSTQTNEQSFMNAVKAERRLLEKSTHLYLETKTLYDRNEWGLAVVEAKDNVAKSITVKAKSWAPAFWAQMTNAPVDIVGVTAANHVATAYTARAGAADMLVDHIEDTQASRKIFFQNPNPITAAVPDLSNVQVDDILIVNTALTGGALQDCVGLVAIARQDAGINHAGVDISRVYQMVPNFFDANQDVVDARMLIAATDRVIPKGGRGKFYGMVPTPVWTKLANDTLALRRLDQSYKPEYVNGVEGIQFLCQAGVLTVTPHPYMHDGRIVISPVAPMPAREPGQENPDLSGMPIRRVGECDIAFGYPGGATWDLPFIDNTAADERRVYACQAPYVVAPGHMTTIENFALTRWD
jgi:hypothetical protein